jgi:hypothetical protein
MKQYRKNTVNRAVVEDLPYRNKPFHGSPADQLPGDFPIVSLMYSLDYRPNI